MKTKKKRIIFLKALVSGIIAGVAFLIISGVVSALFPTPFFKRMFPPLFLDYFFLIAASILLATFVGLHVVQKRKKMTCPFHAASGALSSFISFSCVLCNQLLLFLLGVSGVVAYIQPYQPLLGFIGIGLLMLAVVRKIKVISPSLTDQPSVY